MIPLSDQENENENLARHSHHPWSSRVAGSNRRSTISHLPGISSLPIRSVHTASPFSSWVRHDASPMGMNWSSASRTPIEPGTCPYRIFPLWLIWERSKRQAHTLGRMGCSGRLGFSQELVYSLG